MNRRRLLRRFENSRKTSGSSTTTTTKTASTSWQIPDENRLKNFSMKIDFWWKLKIEKLFEENQLTNFSMKIDFWWKLKNYLRKIGWETFWWKLIYKLFDENWLKSFYMIIGWQIFRWKLVDKIFDENWKKKLLKFVLKLIKNLITSPGDHFWTMFSKLNLQPDFSQRLWNSWLRENEMANQTQIWFESRINSKVINKQDKQ